jgi:hypothetical protein
VIILSLGKPAKVSIQELGRFNSLSIELKNSKVYHGKFIRESSTNFFEFKDSNDMIFTVSSSDILRLSIEE